MDIRPWSLRIGWCYKIGLKDRNMQIKKKTTTTEFCNIQGIDKHRELNERQIRNGRDAQLQPEKLCL